MSLHSRLDALLAEAIVAPPSAAELPGCLVALRELEIFLAGAATESLLLRTLPPELLCRVLVALEATDLASARRVSKIFSGSVRLRPRGLVEEALKAKREEASEVDPIGVEKLRWLSGRRALVCPELAEFAFPGPLPLLPKRFETRTICHVLDYDNRQGRYQVHFGKRPDFPAEVHYKPSALRPLDESSPAELLAADARRGLQPPPMVGVGPRHMALIDAAGRLLTCGAESDPSDDPTELADDAGILGQGDEHAVAELTPAPTPEGVRFVSVACSKAITLVVSTEGHVYSCGQNDHMRLGHGKDDDVIRKLTRIETLTTWRVAQVACGAMHALALTCDGALLSWGNGADGALGHGDHGGPSLGTPHIVGGLRGHKLCAIAAGSRFSFAASEGGAAYAWGFHAQGVLAQGEEQGANMHSPRLIAALRGEVVCGVGAGDAHGLALTVTGRVYAWGSTADGRLGLAEDPALEGPRSLSTPAPIPAEAWGNSRAVCVRAGGKHSLVLTSTGQVYSWGAGAHGRLGTGDDARRRKPTLVSLNGEDSSADGESRCLAASIAAGAKTSVVGCRDGSFRWFGNREQGGWFGKVALNPEELRV